MSDLINRADALALFYPDTQYWGDDIDNKLLSLPSAEQHNKDAISREGLLRSWEELSPRGRTEFDQVIMTIPALPSADAVPQLRQTDTLIIADALRYLAKDTERHLVDRTRADALRQQFLKYGASMCKGGAE